jgi:hypothetical protein
MGESGHYFFLAEFTLKTMPADKALHAHLKKVEFGSHRSNYSPDWPVMSVIRVQKSPGVCDT